MKTTFDIPETLLRKTKAAAALRGQSMKDFVRAALERQVRQGTEEESRPGGWKAVYGRGPRGAREEVDQVVERELSRVNPKDWR
jgi:hypothetical protein